MTTPTAVRYPLFVCLMTAMFAIACAPTMDAPMSSISDATELSSAPVARQIPKEMIIHGDTRIDEYYWLNQREDPDVIAYLEAENSYLAGKLKHTKPLQNKLFEEITGRIKQDDESVPYLSNGYYYYTRYEEDGEYPIYARKMGNLEAPEEIMLNVNEMAVGHDYYAVRGLSVSPDNKLLAYGVDVVSRRKYTIHIKNLETGELFADTIPITTGSTAWANDNLTFFYTAREAETLRSHKIMKHKLGQAAGDDEEIFYEADNTFSTYVYRSKSEAMIIIGASHTLANEYRFLSTDDPDGAFTLMQPRERGHEYSIDHIGDKFYIVTNLDAENFRLMEAPVSDPGKDNWTEVIAHREETLLEWIELFSDHLVVVERTDALRHLRIIRQSDGTEHYLAFDEEAYVASPTGNAEFNTTNLRYSYTSLTTPNSTYDYDMNSRGQELRKRQEVVGGYEPGEFHTQRLWATARDGIKVPVTLVYKKSLYKGDGTNPLLLYAYGSYGSSANPRFSSVRLSLLDRGFVYAIAHVRGGQDMGRSWYDDGKLLKKMNTFTDFIDSGKFLVAENYTSADRMFAEGRSAGGLLMGAVANMAPELFKGILAGVPFVDVVTTMLDESIPLTTFEFDEWGNPKEKISYDYMMTYSPYDNVAAQSYAAMLVTTGLHDSQVQYFEPAKWVARLRAKKTDSNPLYLSTDMDVGHGGASGRFDRYHKTALEYAFLLDLMGIDE